MTGRRVLIPLVLCAVMVAEAFSQGTLQERLQGARRAMRFAISAAEALETSADISVDFAIGKSEVHSVSGFVHGMDAILPMDDLIAPLRPRLWRAGTLADEIYHRATGFGARSTIVCSDLWGYDEANAPYRDYSLYEERMRQIALQSGTRPVILEIWNEPNGSEFWHGTPEQFLETFRRAHDAIRSVRPDAVIAGPSMSFYDHEAIETFLDYALQNNIRVDVLTWHDFRAGLGVPLIEASLLEARQEFVDNPRYQPLGLREIHVNETINESIQFKPASVLAVFDSLERGGADAAARGCWNESNGQNNCWTRTLEGLLTPDTRQPRAIWWAYKAYGEGAGRRVESSSSNRRTFVLASGAGEEAPATEPAQVIVGAYTVLGDLSPVTTVVTMKNLSNVPYLRGRNSVRVSVTPIVDTDEAAVVSLPPPSESVVPISNDSARIELSMVPEAVYVIHLSPGGRSRAVRH